MKQKKNVVLFLCMVCLFALTGCMKFVFNNSQISSTTSSEDKEYHFSEAYSESEMETTTETTTEAISYFGEKSTIRYDQLSDVQKTVYNEIFDGIENFEDSINISESIDETDLDRIYDAIINTADFELVYPTRKYEFKYDVITGNVYKIKPSYSVDLETRTAMISAVDSVADDVISQARGLDAFETVKFFHDYIILNCSYDDSLDNYSNAYGALVEGKAVCEGYARAFKYLCDKVGIPCELVIGSTDVDHMWNVVEIDGKWYHVDVTWDDPKNKDGDYIGYTYFNLSQEEILKDHTIDDTYTVPLAYSMDMNYYNYYNLTVSSIDDLESMLPELIYNSVLNGRKYVYFKADSQGVYEDILDSLGNDYELYKSMKSASASAGKELDTSAVVYSFDDTMLTFTITLG